MHRHLFHRLGLMESAPETPGPVIGGAATPEAASAPAAPAAAEAVKPGLLDTARGIVSSNANLVAANRLLTTNNGQLTAEVARLTTELATATTALTAANTELANVRAALDLAAKEKTDLNTEVTHQLASAGIPESGLPAAGGKAAAGEETLEELQTQLTTTHDSVARGKIVAQMQAARAKQNKALN
jgi:hypothetical protein